MLFILFREDDIEQFPNFVSLVFCHSKAKASDEKTSKKPAGR